MRGVATIVAIAAIAAQGCGNSHVRDPVLDAAVADRDVAAPLDTPSTPDAGSPVDAGPADLPFPVEEPEHPLCVPSSTTFDAWADRRGLFLLVAGSEGAILHHHDGGEWSTWFESADERVTRVAGLDDGPVFLWPSRCSLLRLDVAGSETCIDVPSEDPTHPVETIDAWFDSAETAGLVSRSGDAIYAHRWDRGSVSTRAFWMMDAPIATWGDRVGVFTLSRTGVYAASSATSGRRSDVPPGDYVGLWGVDRDEIGVATGDGRLYVLDTIGWHRHDTAMRAVTAIAGNSALLAMAGDRAVGWWRPEGSRTLVEWTDPRLTVAAVAGYGDDVFAVLRWDETVDDPCGAAVVVRFDLLGTARRL